jgi:predicted TIM-barrel fold metal-dependent hydrolase
MIIDSHVHLIEPRELLRTLHRAGIDGAFIIPAIRKGAHQAPSFAAVKEILKKGSKLEKAVRPDNRLVIEIAKEHKTFFPLAWIDPGRKDSISEVLKCLELGAIGIKLQPSFHRVDLNDERVGRVVETAYEFRAPVFIHTGYDVPPTRVEGLLERYDNPFVLMHMGMFSHYTDAILLAKEYSHVYLDTADPLPPVAVEIALEEVGPTRILMGSDFPFWGHPKIAMEKVRLTGLNKREERLVLGKNALSLIRGT